MRNKNNRIDEYIENAADFAKPVMHHLRELIHIACPDVIANIKWSTPSFEYKGLLCGFGAYKNYCMFGFWKSSLMADPNNLLKAHGGESMGNFGKITRLADLPDDAVIIAYIKEAMLLNDKRIQLPPKPKNVIKKELIIPEILTKALRQNKTAQLAFEKFSPSHKREYAEWISEAKTEATQQKRITQTIEWLQEGKSRNWKYMPGVRQIK